MKQKCVLGVRRRIDAERKYSKPYHVWNIRKYKEGAEKGDPESLYMMACHYRHRWLTDEKNIPLFKLYVYYLRASAEKGYSQAQYKLGKFHSAESKQEYLDFVKAKKWLKRAAIQGHIFAQLDLGVLILTRKVEDSIEEAFHWLKLAAEQNNEDALYYLGYCYYKGIGTAPDNRKAILQLLKSVRYHQEDAVLLLSKCYLLGIGVRENYARFRELLYRYEKITGSKMNAFNAEFLKL